MQKGLVTRIRYGDREAFNLLCRERYASLISYARLFLSGINGSWAEDVVQDVLFGVWQNRRTLKEDDGTLSGKAEIETGIADGEYVEILSGLAEGQMIYYRNKAVNYFEKMMGSQND